MIDINEEPVFPLNELPGKVAAAHPRADGKKIALATLYRWLQQGICGVRLESVLVGGLRHTSMGAYARFVANVTAAKDGPRAAVETPRSEEKRRQAVSKELDRIGV